MRVVVKKGDILNLNFYLVYFSLAKNLDEISLTLFP